MDVAANKPLVACRLLPGRLVAASKVLNSLAADDSQSQRRMTAFVQGLQQFGWTDGRNVTIETRWGAGDSERLRRYAAELVALACRNTASAQNGWNYSSKSPHT